MYEPPLIVDRSRPSMQGDWQQIQDYIAQGHRSEALKVFLKSVGLPRLLIAIMSSLPVWSKIKAVAHTLPYDGAITAEFQTGEPLPVGAWANLTQPALAIAGGKSPAWMQNGSRALAAALPNAQHRTPEGQNHDVSARALGPLLRQFFAHG